MRRFKITIITEDSDYDESKMTAEDIRKDYVGILTDGLADASIALISVEQFEEIQPQS